jgi:type IV pilus assembly protein PilY1
LLHAVDTATGEEQWAFVPEEVIPQLKAVKDNAVGEHIMAADGNPVLYVEDVDKNGEITTGDKAYLIFGLRRGGRALYAIDISDRTNPKFMWKIDNTVTGFSELGETWSTPDVAKMRVSTDPVLVFGAGYDAKANDMMTVAVNRTGGTAQVSTPLDHGYVTGDSVQITGAEQIAYNGTKTITVTGPKTFTYAVAGLPQTPATGSVRVSSNQGATMGRGVFFVNARTGALIRSFTNSSVPGMDYSIPSDTMALNSDIDSIGYADRMYVGDMGGFVWRFDIDDANASNWTVRKFADVTAGASPRRKIFFPPAVVKQEFLGQRFDAVYVGTGDRENPLRTDNEDMMFMIKDSEVGITATGSTVSFNTLDFYDITPNLAQSSDAGIASTAKDNLKAGKGWYFSLATGAVAGGEKVVNAPSVFFNVLRFGTYSPLASVSECVPPGKGAEYAMDANSGVNVVDTNKNGVINGGDSRSVSKYSLRGFPSGGSVVIRDGKVWLHNVSDGVTTGTQIGTAGQAQRAYWFQEPER